MKRRSKIKLVMAVAAGVLSLSMMVMAQGRSGSHGGGPPSGAGGPQGYGPMNNPGLSHMSTQGQQNSQYGRTTAEAARNSLQNAVSPTPTVSPKPTPKGHHYGWQKGKHNPHRSPTPIPTR